jgi:hypothetical protein
MSVTRNRLRVLVRDVATADASTFPDSATSTNFFLPDFNSSKTFQVSVSRRGRQGRAAQGRDRVGVGTKTLCYMQAARKGAIGALPR